ncbi:MAG: isoprenyl transferase [Chitinophagaceae bacterium]|nr:isoprenyl transferase [Chitinophagaceae bacterium]
MSLIEQIDKSRLPEHIAIIMDGNGRWARLHGENRIFGHQNGVSAVRATSEACAELGVKYLTLYAFSTENWARPQYEVDALMELLVATIRNEMSTLMENNIRLRSIGDIASLPAKCHQELLEAMEETKNNSGLTLILALNYSSRWELTEAIRKIASAVKADQLDPRSINEAVVTGFLETAAFPDPELMIRTSGEQRLSNYLLWQLAYAELFFTPVLWPDFDKETLYQAILDFQKRERRFGRTSEQVNVK